MWKVRDRDNGLRGVEGDGGGGVREGIGEHCLGVDSDGCGSRLRKGLVQGGDTGALGFRQGGYRV